MLIKVSVLFVIGVFAGTSIAASIDCNIDECRKPMKIFEELRCKPIYGAKSCCPKRFECADDVRKADSNLCLFDGKSYKVGDVLRRKISNNLKCLETCICKSSSHDNEPAKFLCSTNNCDGISDAKVDNGCVKIYTDVKECCSATTVCAEDEKENLGTCWESSVSYSEGEKFISKSNPCYECLCHKDFDNTTITENSHCRKLNCDIELKYKTFIQRGCLPIFEDDKCCPIDWKCPGKNFKRDVSEITDENDSIETEENYSTESYEDEVTTVFVENSTEPQLVALNLDPFRTPKEEEETSTDEQTKSFDEAQTEVETISTVTEDLINNEESSTTLLSVEENSIIDSGEAPVTVEPTRTFLEDSSPEQHEPNNDNQEDISSETISNTETTIFDEEITTVPNLTEEIKQSDASEVPTTEEISRDKKIPKTHLEAPKLEISLDLELPFNSIDETTILPESSTETHLTESSTEASATENFESLQSTTVGEIEATKSNDDSTTEATKIIPTVIFATHRMPKLIIKPSTHVIPPPPPPPSPTEFEQLLTTLKQYVERLENTLAASKASEIDPPATFVNYTVSRSSNEDEQEENEETKSISKRSAPSLDFLPRYIKHANKEKGCSYGTRHYKLGEKIRTDNECLDCLCLYSPIGHCTKKKQCEA